MTQILKATFQFDRAGDYAVSTHHAQLQGTIVACKVRMKHGTAIVRSMQSGNIMVLLPDTGVPIEDFNEMPLKLEVGPAFNVMLALRCNEPISGCVYVVVHPADAPNTPPDYMLGLVPRARGGHGT